MNLVKAFRVVGYLEGVSFILLLFVAVPVKYFLGNPQGVKALGMPHGILFLLYLVLAFNVAIDLGWNRRLFAWSLVAALLPFGTLVFDRTVLAKLPS